MKKAHPYRQPPARMCFPILPPQILRLRFFLPCEQLLDGLTGVGVLVKHLVGGGDDGHFHTLFPAQFPGGLGGIVALHHGAHLFHGLLRGLPLADEDTGLTIAGVGACAGDDQVAYAGETRQSLLPGARTGYYACSDKGLLLVVSDSKLLSGQAFTIPEPKKNQGIDQKSGALIIEL